jgi:hypothetical protein
MKAGRIRVSWSAHFFAFSWSILWFIGDDSRKHMVLPPLRATKAWRCAACDITVVEG